MKKNTSAHIASSVISCLIAILILAIFGKNIILSGILICLAVSVCTAGAMLYCLKIEKEEAMTDIQPASQLSGHQPVLRPDASRQAYTESRSASAAEQQMTGSQNRNTTADSLVSELNEAAARSSFFSPLISELSDSISKNLSSTTEPLSEQLLAIRRTIAGFLDSVKRYETEVKNHTMLTRMSHESDLLKSDIASLDTNVRDAFSAIKLRINEMQIVAQRIADVANNITEVSDKIRILSFNASIEAARAGKIGSGFRVIAAEIKNLSAKTEEHLSLIWKTLKETRAIFEGVQLSIDTSTTSISTVLSTRRQGLASFFDTTHTYFDDFDHLYTSVNEVISFLSSSMDSISPVVQLHEITSQEVGNLKLAAADYSSYMTKILSKTAGISSFSRTDPSYRKIAEETAKEVRRHLTTERELNALERGIKKNIPDLSIDLGINNNAIELF